MHDTDTPNDFSPLSEFPSGKEISTPVETITTATDEPTNWMALAQKLREHNRELVKTVVNLEQALSDAQEALKMQIMRSRNADTLIAQQAEELTASQGQVTRLFHELEISHQSAQRQQTLIETLAEQLENSQQNFAHLEREYANLQERYNDQTNRLLRSEQQVQELRTELHRQQRQTQAMIYPLDHDPVLTPPRMYEDYALLEMELQQEEEKLPPNVLVLPTMVSHQEEQKDEPKDAEMLLFSDEDFPPLPIDPDTEMIAEQAQETVDPSDNFESPSESGSIPSWSFSLQQRRFSRSTKKSEGNTSSPQLISLFPAHGRSNAPIPLETKRQETPQLSSSEKDILSDLDHAVRESVSEPIPLSVVRSRNVSSVSNQESRQQSDPQLDIEPPSPSTMTMADSDYGFGSAKPAPLANWPSPVIYPWRQNKKRRTMASIELPNFINQHPRYR